MSFNLPRKKFKMGKETTSEVEENVFRHKILDQNSIIHEYENIIACLKEELSNCKSEQVKLRTEIEALQKDNQNAVDIIHRTFAECNHDNCDGAVIKDEEAITNLEQRITMLQKEKDSVYQLWQMALKAIDVLEEELKAVRKDDKSTKFYQEQINNIKETYSEAIRVLEAKLGAVKESYFQQQNLLDKNKEKVDQLTKEKNEIIQQLNTSQQQTLEKEKSHQITLDSVKEDLKDTKKELEKMRQSRINLEEQLRNAQKKEYEAKNKVAEALFLIDSAVEEKKEALNRESKVIAEITKIVAEKTKVAAEKNKLETDFAKISEEYTNRLETEVLKAKEIYTKNVKEYLLEIKELKAKVREQATLLDRSQRECRLLEEELEKVRHNSDNLILRSNTRIADLEQSVHEKQLRLQTAEDNHKSVYDDKMNDLERQVSHLEDKLLNTSERLKRVQLQSCRDVKDQVRETDDRTREILEKCSFFERQLSRALMDKENLTSNLHSLELSFEKEMQRRNHEKILLENKIQDLQEKIKLENIVNESRTFSDNMSNKRHIGQQTLMNVDSISNILSLQEKYEKKTKDLIQHVETHQKLSNKWKEEANLLANKFQKRSQELKNKISALQKQNDELTKELLFYQQLLARCNSQMVQNFNRDTENR